MLEEAVRLCERLEALVQDARQVLHEPGALERLHDLHEVQAAIAALRAGGLSIPEDLRAIQTSLAADSRRQESAHQTLALVRERLPSMLRALDAGHQTPGRARRRPAEPDGTGTLFDI